MQSFLAYRRFGSHVKKQYERDLAKAEALRRGNAEAQEAVPNTLSAHENTEILGHRHSSIDTTSSETVHEPNESSDDRRDLEKGEHIGPGIMDGEDGGELANRQTLNRSESFGTRLGHVLSGIEVRTMTKEIAKTRSKGSRRPEDDAAKREERDKLFVVGYESDKDALNPHNWSTLVRIRATMLIASIGFIVGYASAVDSAALSQASEDFGVSSVTEVLGSTGIFLIGFGFGAPFAGPISETGKDSRSLLLRDVELTHTVGRNPVYIVTLLVYMCWVLGAALAPNIGSQIVFRFLAGFFGSTPLTCAGGSISDLWNPMERVYAFPVFANAAFMGPIFGPVCGGFIGQYADTWRWTEWSTLIASGVILVSVILFQPETYAPVLLSWKAAHLRKITGDDRYVAEIEIRADPFFTRLLHALYRPFVITAREPIVVLFALYLTVVYIILFTFLDGYDYIYGDTYGFSEGLTGLAFIGIAIGLCFASLWIPLIHRWAKRDLIKVKKAGGSKLPPEKRLWFAMFGAPAIPISLFWMGWTNYTSISYWSGLVASVVFGYGILCIFISSYQYIIDAYELYAASALASLTFIRYVAAGGMTIVSALENPKSRKVYSHPTGRNPILREFGSALDVNYLGRDICFDGSSTISVLFVWTED